MPQNNQSIILTKTYSREHTLSYCYVWYLSDKLAYNIQNVLFIRQADSNRVNVWYDNQEISAIINGLIKKLNETDYLQELVKTFYDYWRLLEPVLSGKSQISTLQDLELYFNNLVHWWSVMAVITVAPDSMDLKTEIKDKFLTMRKETEIYTDKQDEIFQNYLKEYLPQLKEVAYVISPIELFKASGNLSDTELTLIKERLHGYVLAHDQVIPLGELNNFLRSNNLELATEKIEIKDNIIKGQIAFKGKARGIVHIILNKEELKNFKDGEILVTEMTSPEFVPAMKKSAAIVTNEGGITCHAAIISRELGKPCIIGTKVATKVLKDGDTVEVDADKGVVKILR
ncbi:MAG: PEP-utilizing enzyme [Candidatus Parcubacteria bacterium]|nr:PEP-utilizing enzyme [Candidatus Parcubacteria bacterium]